MFLYVFLLECMAREKRIMRRLIIYTSKSIHSCFIDDFTDVIYNRHTHESLLQNRSSHFWIVFFLSEQSKAVVSLIISFINLSIMNSPFIQLVFTTYKHLLPLALEASFYIRHMQRISRYVSVPCASSRYQCLCIWNSCDTE